MATLTSEQIDEVLSTTMQTWSSIREPTPVNKSQLRSGIILFDEALEDTEAAILVSIPPGPVRDWIVANQAIARQLIVDVSKARRDNL